MSEEKIDYTTWRKGRVVKRWTYLDKATGEQKPACSKIIVCPKCGRKGESSGKRTLIKDGTFAGKWSLLVTHCGRIVTVGGLAMFMVDDHCTHLAHTPEGDVL